MRPADWRATSLFLASLALAALAGPFSLGASAWIAALGLGAAYAWEARDRQPREWFRIDWAALAAAYYLTLAEFLVPQPQFATEVSPAAATAALRLVLLGLAALAIGRHLPFPRLRRPLSPWPQPSRQEWVILLLVCFALGHFAMFSSVGFNPVRLIQELLGPRFSQPWARPRLGDATSFWSELQLLNYLIPPITAVLLVTGGPRPWWARAVLASPLAFLLFAAFCSGTRYVLATHVATFAVALAWSWPGLSRRRAFWLFAAPGLVVLISTVAALQFRHGGLGRALQGTPTTQPHLSPPRRFIVDNNLRTIAKLTETFPEKHPYLGLEVPWHMLVRPVPRALFPGKPEKLSLSMEEIIGIPQTTIAASFAGEGFLMAGAAGTMLFGLLLGSLCAAWNRIPVAQAGSLAIVLYAAGVHWAFLGTRSPIWLSIGFLPSIALLIAVWIAFPVARRLLPAQGERDHGSPRL